MLSNSKLFLLLTLFAGSSFAAAGDPNRDLAFSLVSGNVAKAREALDKGAEINDFDYGRTPLWRAVNYAANGDRGNPSTEMIQFLLDNDADLVKVDGRLGMDETPLHTAIGPRAHLIVPLLLAYDETGQARLAKDYFGRTPYDLAMFYANARKERGKYEEAKYYERIAEMLAPLGG